MRPRSSEPPVGAYGLQLAGVDGAAPLLPPAGAGWPRLVIRSRAGREAVAFDRVDESSALLRLRTGGQIAIDRAAGEAVFTTEHVLAPDELVHPFLAPVAAVMAYWLGRDALHAGAFVVDGRAWAVVAERGAGKSSILGWLALSGAAVLADDLLVLEEGAAFPGPRSVDLRADAAEALGHGEPLGTIGARERWRLRLPPIGGDAVAIAGWVALAWGERPELSAVPASERVALLAAQAAVRLPSRTPERLLELAALPAVRLSRPRRWDAAAASCELLLDALRG